MSSILDISQGTTYRRIVELLELGATIRHARQTSGISQAQLAAMTGISRATLNYAEQGRSALGADALLRILDVVGLRILPIPAQRQDAVPAVALLADGASVSFKESIPASVVERILAAGAFDEQWLPHVARIVDEASDATLLRAVREVSSKTSIPASRVWRNLRDLAIQVASPNPRWT